MNSDFTLKAYTYHLPQKNIAQKPADRRDHSRLLVLATADNSVSHHQFTDITDFIRDEDMLVVNDTRVFPARLHGRKDSGGRCEVFLLGYPELGSTVGTARVEALIKSSKRPREGSRITINDSLFFTVVELLDGGKAVLEMAFSGDIDALLSTSGQVPLPPYISREEGTTDEDIKRYQTVYANQPGAVAAPTAGLHFTEELLESLQRRGVKVGAITLHVGYGTFAPVRVERILDHQIHHEYVAVPRETVEQIEETKKRGGRIWAVGTTTVRALEFAARSGSLKPTEDWCDLYIYPGFTFRVIDNLITNFHLPQSSLLFLVSALAGRERMLNAYNHAVEQGYRFFSYGDAMAIITKG